MQVQMNVSGVADVDEQQADDAGEAEGRAAMVGVSRGGGEGADGQDEVEGDAVADVGEQVGQGAALGG